MSIRDQYSVTEELQEARWNASMDALEANWLKRIAATQAEYQEERMRLRGKRPEPAIVSASAHRQRSAVPSAEARSGRMYDSEQTAAASTDTL